VKKKLITTTEKLLLYIFFSLSHLNLLIDIWIRKQTRQKIGWCSLHTKPSLILLNWKPKLNKKKQNVSYHFTFSSYKTALYNGEEIRNVFCFNFQQIRFFSNSFLGCLYNSLQFMRHPLFSFSYLLKTWIKTMLLHHYPLYNLIMHCICHPHN